jgi:hypothetical protein
LGRHTNFRNSRVTLTLNESQTERYDEVCFVPLDLKNGFCWFHRVDISSTISLQRFRFQFLALFFLLQLIDLVFTLFFSISVTMKKKLDTRFPAVSFCNSFLQSFDLLLYLFYAVLQFLVIFLLILILFFFFCIW